MRKATMQSLKYKDALQPHARQHLPIDQLINTISKNSKSANNVVLKRSKRK